MTLAIILIALVFIYSALYAAWRAAPWIPVHTSDITRLCTVAAIKPGETVYELGCGDARFTCAAANLGAKAIGFEVFLLPYLLAHLRRIFQKNRRQISIRFRDFWLVNLNDADIVYFWLTPKINDKLRNKFERELRPGARVVCYVWPVEGWIPDRIDERPGHPKIFLYQR